MEYNSKLWLIFLQVTRFVASSDRKKTVFFKIIERVFIIRNNFEIWFLVSIKTFKRLWDFPSMFCDFERLCIMPWKTSSLSLEILLWLSLWYRLRLVTISIFVKKSWLGRRKQNKRSTKESAQTVPVGGVVMW